MDPSVKRGMTSCFNMRIGKQKIGQSTSLIIIRCLCCFLDLWPVSINSVQVAFSGCRLLTAAGHRSLYSETVVI